MCLAGKVLGKKHLLLSSALLVSSDVHIAAAAV